MRQDCPHCRQSLQGKFIRWSKIQQTDHMRSCPRCGKEIEHAIHPEELAIRAIAIVVAIGVCYAMNTGRHGFVAPLVAGLVILVVVYALAQFRLRNAQRYKKGRNEA
jgi:uncharacterized protein (DUF983 family)